MIDVNPRFLQVLDFINQTNQPLFLTGKAGTGKTTLLRFIREKTLKQLAVVAPTGVAAINAGGATIHSFFQFPFKPFLPALSASGQLTYGSAQLGTLKYNAQRLSIFRKLELLIIDEVSMVRADLLDQIDQTLRFTRRRMHQPFGGVQVLLIGDMYQLPPVVPAEEWQFMSSIYKSPFFFDSLVMRNLPPVYIELQKVYRQTDQEFIDLLNKVRNNVMDRQSLDLLNSRYNANITEKEYQENITLTTHNRKADEINTRNLAALPGFALRFEAKVEGQFSEKNYPNDAVLTLKVGTRVMFLKNNPEKNYFNGKIAEVTFLSEEKIKVRAEGDKAEIEVPRESWMNVNYKIEKSTGHIEEEVLGTYSHFPLRLAWAITIHKSQGLTFDKLIIDAAEAFSAGQVYVALSRCRSLSGLTLSSRIEPSSLSNDQNILDFARHRQDDNQVQKIYTDARRQYQREILTTVFDFSDFQNSRRTLAEYLQLHQKRFSHEGQQWFSVLAGRIDALADVAVKFRRQLEGLFDAARDLENNSDLNERLASAANYFESELKKCSDYWSQCSLSTDNKEAATDIDTPLAELGELLNSRQQILQGLHKGFNFQTYMKTRLEIKPLTKKMSVYASAQNTRTAEKSAHPDLFRALLEKRDELVAEFQKPVYLVATNKTLMELSQRLPTSKEQLLEISGFGPARVASFGQEFLKVIKEYCAFHNLDQTQVDIFDKTAKKTKKATKEPKQKKVPTAEITLHYFREGKSLSEIAAIRKMTIATVARHLEPLIQQGELRIDELVPNHRRQLIEKALQAANYEDGLKPVKERLPDDFTYEEIRLVQAHRLRD